MILHPPEFLPADVDARFLVSVPIQDDSAFLADLLPLAAQASQNDGGLLPEVTQPLGLWQAGLLFLGRVIEGLRGRRGVAARRLLGRRQSR